MEGLRAAVQPKNYLSGVCKKMERENPTLFCFLCHKFRQQGWLFCGLLPIAIAYVQLFHKLLPFLLNRNEDVRLGYIGFNASRNTLKQAGPKGMISITHQRSKAL